MSDTPPDHSPGDEYGDGSGNCTPVTLNAPTYPTNGSVSFSGHVGNATGGGAGCTVNLQYKKISVEGNPAWVPFGSPKADSSGNYTYGPWTPPGNGTYTIQAVSETASPPQSVTVPHSS